MKGIQNKSIKVTKNLIQSTKPKNIGVVKGQANQGMIIGDKYLCYLNAKYCEIYFKDSGKYLMSCIKDM